MAESSDAGPSRQDGRPALSAPTLRTADGKPDFSGVWMPSPDPAGEPGGVEGVVTPRFLRDVTVDMPADRELLQPAAAEAFRQRRANFLRDSPLIRCMPVGVPRLNAYAFPYKFIQLPHLIVILYEAQTMFRQIFMDGRALPPAEAQPTWMGYSVGRWEGETLVVESSGFNGKAWLDGGHTFSEAMRLTERFRRLDVGRMEVEVTVDDPQTYTMPIRYVQPLHLLPDNELIEYVCENPKEVFRAPIAAPPGHE